MEGEFRNREYDSVQDLIQLRAEEVPIMPLDFSLLP